MTLPFPARRDSVIIDRCKPYSFGNDDDFALMCGAVDYIHERDVPGVICEVGVWKGGMMLCAALAQERRARQRRLVLYDTFTGMTAPDPGVDGSSSPEWGEGKLVVSVGDVARLMDEAQYQSDLEPVYVACDIREHHLRPPHAISILRVDVDWCDSTLAALRLLEPRVSPGGVIILDDYDYWPGAKRAADEYFPAGTDFIRAGTGRVVIK